MGQVSESRYTVQAGWDDVPHLDETTKRELYDSTMPYLRDARSKGIPSLGSGAIYPIPWDDVTCKPFAIPAHWKRCYGLDVGWNRTAAMWIAEDPLDGVRYAYSEYYKGQAIPLIHAEGIKARGAWIPGAIDPASRGRNQVDGEQLWAKYEDAGLLLNKATNAVETGLYDLWSRLETGRFKFFTTLRHTESEYRLYRRDEKGVIVKKNDHLMDAGRYGNATFEIAVVRPAAKNSGDGFQASDNKAGY